MLIFVSWSGTASKTIADAIEQAIHSIFTKHKIEVFFSKNAIPAGAVWFAEINEKIHAADYTILCCTPESVDAPWVNFEAGACKMDFSSEVRIVPLLIGQDSLDARSPLSNFNCVKLSEDGFRKIVKEINAFLGADQIPINLLNQCITAAYKEHFTDSKEVKQVIRTYKSSKLISAQDIYPREILHVQKKSVFLSSPMASLTDEEYRAFQQDMLKIQEMLRKACKAKSVFYPGMKINTKERFDGMQLAIRKNFKLIKQCEYLFVVYPGKIPSSVLTEIGYALALSKKIIVFVKEKSDLPYILQEADIGIDTFTIYTYSSVDDILRQMEINGTAFLQ